MSVSIGYGFGGGIKFGGGKFRIKGRWIVGIELELDFAGPAAVTYDPTSSGYNDHEEVSTRYWNFANEDPVPRPIPKQPHKKPQPHPRKPAPLTRYVGTPGEWISDYPPHFLMGNRKPFGIDNLLK